MINRWSLPHPKSYYGIFSFLFRTKIYILFVGYFLGLVAISVLLSFFIQIKYAGPIQMAPECLSYYHILYYVLTTLVSPGFTEFLPSNDLSRILSLITGVLGVAYNALFFAILITRFLQPHEPFVLAPFLLYNPKSGALTARLYSMLPLPVYNLKVRCHRFMMHYKKKEDVQIGKSIEIMTIPTERNMLLPNYGLLIHIPLEEDMTPYQSSPNRRHKRKKCPIEWVLPIQDDKYNGYFYITIEAETMYGKMFKTQNFYLNKSYIKCGMHSLLNHQEKFTLKNWHNWKDYRWDLWGKYEPIPDTILSSEINNPLINAYYEKNNS